jgi:hypothetical protein
MHLSVTPALRYFLPQIRQTNIGTVAVNSFIRNRLAAAAYTINYLLKLFFLTFILSLFFFPLR